MSTTRPGRRAFVPAALLAGALALTAGCGGSSGTADASAPKPAGAKAPLFSALPSSYQSSKTITVGSDIAYAPMEYYDTDGQTVTGFDKDLADALGRQLGVDLAFKNASFDGLVTALRSDRIDVVISGMSDTADRQKRVDFVDYYRAGPVLLVKKGNPEGLHGLPDLCGRTVAIQRGTTQEDIAKRQARKCTAAGHKPVRLLSFDRETEALLQVKQGRADSGLEDYPVASYNAKTSGGGKDFQVVGKQIEAGPIGIAVRKSDTKLRAALQKAVQRLIGSGEYAKLLKKWDIPAGALTTSTVNAGS